MSLSQLQAKCAKLGLHSQGDSISVTLRILYHHFGTASVADPYVAVAVAPAVIYPANVNEVQFVSVHEDPPMQPSPAKEYLGKDYTMRAGDKIQ